MLEALLNFIANTGFVLIPSNPQNLIMIGVGLGLIYLFYWCRSDSG